MLLVVGQGGRDRFRRYPVRLRGAIDIPTNRPQVADERPHRNLWPDEARFFHAAPPGMRPNPLRHKILPLLDCHGASRAFATLRPRPPRVAPPCRPTASRWYHTPRHGAVRTFTSLVPPGPTIGRVKGGSGIAQARFSGMSRPLRVVL